MSPDPRDALLVAALLLAVNAATFAAFARDKHAARVHARRIRERTLLMLAFLGGTPAAYLSRHFLRHKTVKQPFVAALDAIATLQAIALAGAAGLILSDDARAFVRGWLGF